MAAAHRPARRTDVLRNRLIAATLCLMAVSLPAYAGYDEGQEFYKQKRYAEAAVEYEEAVAQKPKHAMAHYKLGLTYAQLKRHAEALTEFDKALALDPGLAQRTTINEAIDRARSKVSKQSKPSNGSRPQSGDKPAPKGAQGLINVLQQGSIYVHPAMRSRLSTADEAAVASHLAGTGLTVKVAVVPTSEVKKEATSLAAYANRLSSYLRVGDDGVVIAVSDKGVSAVGGSLKKGDMEAIVADSLVDFSGSYKQGIIALTDRIAARRQTREAQSTGFWVFLLMAGVAIVAFFWWRKRARGAKLKTEINQLMGEFSDRMAAAGDDLQYVTADPRAAEARQLFDEATAIYLDVDKKLPETSKPADLAALLPRMRQALTLMGYSQTMIKALINGETPPKRSELKEKDVIPAAEAGVRHVVGSPTGCFFCSRPITPAEGSLVDVQQDGRTIRVMACPTCTAAVENGRTPQVVGYYDSGRFTPWYERPGYDYQRDRGGLSLGDVMLLSWLFDRPTTHHHHYGSGGGGGGGNWRHDESTAERYTSDAAEGSLMGSGSSYSDTGEAAEGSFWSSSSSDAS
jgi:tetratricopeptide (TPR) repeat protein/ribosomal protein L24E